MGGRCDPEHQGPGIEELEDVAMNREVQGPHWTVEPVMMINV
jgi:hypothetical protein